MRSLVLVFALFFAAAWASDIIPDEYIVLLRPGLTDNDLAQHLKTLKGNFTIATGSNILYDVFQIGSDYKSLHVRMTPEMLRMESVDPMVLLVEPNRRITATQSCNIQRNVIWNLDRVDERTLDLVNADYTYDANGEGVNAYIVDTGILLTHVEFEGRAVWGTNTIDTRNVDCNGHGTHVASTVGGRLYGVAKKVTLIAVKVLDCSGSGTTAGVINGVNWVASQHKSAGKRSVANMSLGGGLSTTLNNAVDAAVDAGVSFVVAAGNDNRDACSYSPASAPKAIGVAATTSVDKRASFSNFGTCVAILAPGQTILGAWIGSDTATNTISGTSMASPHTCGVAALTLSRNPNLTPAQVKTLLSGDSTPNVIDLACTTSQCLATPNKFLYSGACKAN